MLQLIKLQCLVFLSLISSSCSIVNAQATNQPTIPASAKVYVTSERDYLARIAGEEIKKYRLWTLTDQASEADVVMDVKVRKIGFNDREAHAVFSDAKTGTKLTETPTVNSLMRFTFAPRRGAVRKLIRKRIQDYYLQNEPTVAVSK
ncbi:hypothetical protein [Aridibaculum aurantiacum]|uniref:hypothetical protein n=1 Tax=Aridibaculum aurantiacum TaxID=2810307 RepID=UPI001A975D52|nr:hypothetical protein [Aridibaculum aurantiacum]